MKPEQKKRFIRLANLLNGLIFLLGAVALLKESKTVLAIPQLVASVLNFSLLLKIRNDKLALGMSIAVFVLNILVCLTIAVDYFLSGSSYIQYAWILAAVLSLIALIFLLKRFKNRPDEVREKLNLYN